MKMCLEKARLYLEEEEDRRKNVKCLINKNFPSEWHFLKLNHSLNGRMENTNRYIIFKVERVGILAWSIYAIILAFTL